MGGNDYYVKERPNPEALTHTEIFERLVMDGMGASGPGPTEPLLVNGELLHHTLQELAAMIGSLEVSFQAGSTQLAGQAIDNVSQHVDRLAMQSSQVADGFNGYVEAYHETRNRVPPPVPFAEQLDAIDKHYPGLLAHLPFIAELEEEHQARTREARAAYHRLDWAAVAADAATPGFPLMFGPVADTTIGTGTFDSSGTAGRWPGAAGYGPAGMASSSTTPAAIGPGSPATPVLPPPAVGGSPVPTPGAASGGGGPAAAPPLLSPPSPGGHGSGGFGPVPPGVAPGQWGRFGPNPGGHPGGVGSRAGGVAEGGSGRGGGGPGSGWRAGSSGSPVGDAGAVRPAGVGGRGAPGVAVPGFGPLGTGSRKEEDHERERPQYLEADQPAESLFGTDQKVAPPVIGAAPPPSHHA